MPIANLIPRRLPLSLSFIPALRLHSIHPLLGLPSPLNPYNTRHIPLHIAVSWYPPTPFLRGFPSNVLRRMRIAFNRDSNSPIFLLQKFVSNSKYTCIYIRIQHRIFRYSCSIEAKKKKRIATSFSSPSWFTAEVNQSRSGGVWKGMEREREREVWIARRDQLRSCRVPWEVNQPTFLRPRRRGDSRFRSRGKFRFIQLVDTSRHHCRFYIPLSGYRGWFQWQRMMDRLRGNTYAGRRRRKEIVYPSRFPWAIKEIAS